MPSKNAQVVLWLGVGIAAATLGVGYLAYQRSLQTQSGPQGFTISIPPATTSTMSPGAPVIPGQTANSGTQGTSFQPNPGSSVMFNFTPPPGVGATQPALFSSAGINASGGSSCGCATPGSVAGSCTPGGGTVGAYGSPADVASSIAANLGPSITAAFTAGQQIRHQQALNTLSNNPAGAGVAMFTIPPAASIGL